MVISGEALCLNNIHTDTNFASKLSSSKISPQGQKPLRTSRMANPYTDNMDLDEVMLKTEDSTSDANTHDFYKNESRHSSRKLQKRNSSLKLICIDKVQTSGQKEYSDTKTEEATNELKRKVSEK